MHRCSENSLPYDSWCSLNTPRRYNIPGKLALRCCSAAQCDAGWQGFVQCAAWHRHERPL